LLHGTGLVPGLGSSFSEIDLALAQQVLVTRRGKPSMTRSRQRKQQPGKQLPERSGGAWRGPDLVLEHANPGYLALFPGRELLGKRPLDAFPEMGDQPLLDFLYRVMETGEPHIGRETLVRHRRSKDGPIVERYYDFAYIRINGADGKPYGVYDFALDVTERVLARQALEAKQRELQAANEELRSERDLRDRFVAMLTHDLRTPLNVASMSTQLAVRKAERPQDVMAHAAKAMEAIARIDRMIQDFLDASRLKSGRGLEIEPNECEIVSLVRSTCDELTALHGADFRVHAPEQLAGYWSGTAIRRAIENLGSNAVKYGDATRPITASIADLGGDAIEISVHNYGPPIAPADFPTLFDAFMRSRTAEGKAKGWGLGLSLVRGVAEAHGGTVRVESSETSGTTFTLRLPRDCRRSEVFGPHEDG
jgi:signal transduction histidine kinase